ncbi:LPS assembly lipoprotein LptE [Massilia sp. CF038]|uniref:LPS-assembly lipoprotein LptE n=1 Tax=Massilia sp. CF038 TaxID=1881045 RepID=UPI00091C9201|nr:LPS assembly lipoprotein LptE [Massilia sp. CF038]SHH55086.1 LPS-assembly lipoprotein [Massilia sp. CF038]
MSAFRKLVLMLAVLASLSACGFQLRGSNGEYRMPFKSIYLNFPDTSALGIELRRNLRGGDMVEVVTDATQAQAQFDVVSEARGKQILSLKGQGRVGEYLLTYTVVFKVSDANGRTLLPPTEITLKRSLPFDERQILAKESEEVLLFRDMQSDLVQQILRRMTAIKAQ